MSMANATTLGELESAVMHHLWEVEHADVKAVWSVVGQARGVTHNTVQSTMERLYRKGLLRRGKVSHAYVYTPALTQAAFRAQAIRTVAEAVGDVENDMLAAFVDVAADVGDETLARLEKLVAARRRQEADDDAAKAKPSKRRRR